MLDYLPDIASDLSRFHRIDDANTLEAPVFFALVRRLSAYGGMIAARLQMQAEPGRVDTAAQQAKRPEPAPVTPQVLRELNAKLGANAFSFAAVSPDA